MLSRGLGLLAACVLVAAALPATATASTRPGTGATQAGPGTAQVSSGAAQAGPFETGNLLDYANADFEGTTGDWVAVSNATLTDDSGQHFLHDDSLLDTATSAGTSSFAIAGGTPAVKIKMTRGASYRVGAYFKAPAAAGQTVQFSLGCYKSSGGFAGWSDGTVNSLLASGNWQYSEDDIAVPADCAYVLGSPQVTLGGLAAGAAVNMDEAAFTPYRAAQVIGAHGDGVPYNAADWFSANGAAGPLQSDKQFWMTELLPDQWNESTNACYEIEQSVPDASGWPACVIAYGVQESQAQIAKFLANVPAAQMVIMVYYSEPEGKFSSGAQFVSQFETQSQNIRAAAGDAPNIFVALDSSSYEYGTRASDSAGTGCGYIVAPQYVDFYLVDHYDEGASGNSLPDETTGPAGDSNGQKWLNWLGCVQSMNKPLGLAEYGLDCHSDPDQPVVTDEMEADDNYLSAIPGATEPTIMWDYWYDTGCQFSNSAGGLTAWRSFETQNGGGSAATATASRPPIRTPRAALSRPAPTAAAGFPGALNGISALSPSDVWAVGYDPAGSLIVHWNGSSWSQEPAPGPADATLNGVSMVSPTDGWAVGSYLRTSPDDQFRFLILHWNGTSWTQVPAPAPAQGALRDVSMVSASDGWAVGVAATGPGGAAVVLHWNGTSWTQMQIPVTSGFSDLFGVSAGSASDAWAVGSAGIRAMTLHWNGTSWTQVSTPSPGRVSSLSAVSDASGLGAWAVGLYGTATTKATANMTRTLTLHWDGTTWQRIRAPSPGQGIPSDVPINELAGVAITSPSSAWSVGDDTVPVNAGQAAMTVLWNGTSWTRVKNPGGAAYSFLTAVSMLSPSEGWAAGRDDSTGQAVILHWNGTSWTRS
jgi:hypothetical protein